MPDFRDVIPGTRISAGQASVAGLQAELASGRLTAAALTAFYLQRIDHLNPALHAVITVNLEAPAEAAASDAARGPRGPLEGIPVLVKDNIQVTGMPTTAGSPALLAAEPADAFLVQRLRAAGAVIIGKANLSEWANFRSIHSTSGWSTLGGQTANPYALDRNPSGSSSGSAAGVAAGLAPLARGAETAGAILSPARARGGGGGSGPARRRHRNRRLDPLPGQCLRGSRHQAHQRPGQPPGHRADLTGAGHRGTDSGLRRGRGGAAVRAGRRRPRGSRRGRRPRSGRTLVAESSRSFLSVVAG